MGIGLTLGEKYIPGFIRRRQLVDLFAATAGAFQTAMPSLTGLSFAGCLKLYAQYTSVQALRAIQGGCETEVQTRLFEAAYCTGQRLKRDFAIRTPTEVMRAGALIYRILEIDFQGDPGGHILIRSCFFSRFYSSQQCRLISSLDEGLLTGMAGGGQLCFSQRITEGSDGCRAFLEIPGRPK